MKKILVVLFLLVSCVTLSSCGAFLEDYSYSPVGGSGYSSNSGTGY